METPKLVDVELVSAGWLNKYILHYEKPDGSRFSYESISRKPYEAYKASLYAAAEGNSQSMKADAVGIVPITTNNEVVLIKEFRYPLNSWCLSCPAGLREADEDILDCVKRELREETGYALATHSKVKILPQAGFSSNGMSDETVQVVFAEVEKVGDAQLEDIELIEVITVPLDELSQFLAENTIPIGTRCQLALEYLAK